MRPPKKSRTTPVSPVQTNPSRADVAARAVGADEEPRGDPPRRVPLDLRHGPDDRVVRLGELGQPPPVLDRHARQRLGVAAQHLLDVLLRDPVRKLGRAPRPRHRAHPLACLARGRQPEPRELVRRVAREVRDVGREVLRQPERANLLGEPEPAVVLHRARLRRVRLRVDGRRRLRVEQRDAHTTAAELVGEHQPERAAARDQDVDRRVAGPPHSRAD
jgi:hypothetical protein